jgi:hypothetical protein
MRRVAKVLILSVIILADLMFGHNLRDRRRITESEARELAMKALPEEMIKNPAGLVLNSYKNSYFPDAYYFEALWAHPTPVMSSIVAGHYAVDSETAEVWKSNICERITSRALQQLQKELRKRIGLSEEEYRKLIKKHPPC